MASVSIFKPNQLEHPLITDFQVLQLTRPTYKACFVRRGDETHLLVYLNGDHALPFVRIPCDVLAIAARHYEESLH